MRLALDDTTLRWAVIAAIGLTAASGLWALDVRVVWHSLLILFALPAGLLSIAAAYGLVGRLVPRLAFPIRVASDFLLSGSQMLVLMLAFLPLTYLAAAAGFPLRDAELTRLDAVLFGFDWDQAARWVALRPTLDLVLSTAYATVVYQAGAVLLIGSIDRPGDRNGDFLWQCIIASLMTCAVFVFTPALGKVGHIGTGQVETLTQIHAGLWTVFDYSHSSGLVNFPSFHTTLAILFVYAVRRHWWALAVLAPLDVVLISATPTVGGHYLVDLPAGAAVAVAAIAATRSLRERLGAVRPRVQLSFP